MRDRNDPERWAWHLAWAALGVDEEAAAALELAAQQALARSSYAAAAAALERAASLTADEELRLRASLRPPMRRSTRGHADDALALLAGAAPGGRGSRASGPRR